MGRLRTLLLIRQGAFPGEGVYGQLTLEDLFKSVTLERNWNYNKVAKSCIPGGIYKLKPRYYNRGGYDVVELIDVPGRTLILIHKANWASELLGCITVAAEIGRLRGFLGVIKSGYKFRQLMKILNEGWAVGDEFQIKISAATLSYTIEPNLFKALEGE